MAGVVKGIIGVVGKQILNPKKYVRNAGLVALGVVFFPAAAAATTAATAGTSASTAFVGTAAQQAFGAGTTIVNTTVPTLKGLWMGGTSLASSAAAMPWSEMIEAAQAASVSPP